MKSYLIYKNQIQGIKDVSETVKAAEKIAASSVHFLKQRVTNLNIYAVEVEKMLARLSVFYQKKDHPFLQKKHTGKKTLVILTGNKGLTGGLWHNIINAFLENAKQYQSIIVVGAKGEHYLKEENAAIIKLFVNFSDVSEKEEIRHITSYIFNGFEEGMFSQVDILYPQFISLAEQTASFIPFLPFEFISLEATNYGGRNVAEDKGYKQSPTDLKLTKKSGEGLPIFEPSKRKVFDRLLQKYIEIFFYKIIMETKLSEFSARTVAMEHATAKTGELIQKLALNYAKERRRVVTQRQLESFAAHKII